VEKLQEELNGVNGEVLHLNRIVAESNGKICQLNADIDGLKAEKEVRVLSFIILIFCVIKINKYKKTTAYPLC